MERPKWHDNGAIGWLAVAGIVATWDYLAGETMSSAFSRGLENPVSRPLVLGGLALTAAHLLDGFTVVGLEAFDPFKALGKLVRD